MSDSLAVEPFIATDLLRSLFRHSLSLLGPQNYSDRLNDRLVLVPLAMDDDLVNPVALNGDRPAPLLKNCNGDRLTKQLRPQFPGSPMLAPGSWLPLGVPE